MNQTRPRIPLKDESQQTPIVSDAEKEYGKLAAVFTGIFLLSVFAFIAFDGEGPFNGLMPIEAFAAQFMGIFFIVFAIFKLVNLKGFIHGFMMYDVIAKRSRVYATAYPFIQLLLGLLMFITPKFAVVHLVAAIVSGLALLGVFISLSSKKKIQCACLGNVIKMALAIVSGFEDGSMFVISALMFIAMIG